MNRANEGDRGGDRDLALRVSSGDPKAFQAMYDRFSPMVFTTAQRLSASSDIASDVLQDFFVALPENLKQFRGHGSLEGWLRRVSTNMTLTTMRRNKRRREVPIAALSPQNPATTQKLEQSIIDGCALESALARLSEPLRVVFVLKEVEGYTHAEIGRLLGIRPGTSEVRLHRAKQELRRLLR